MIKKRIIYITILMLTSLKSVNAENEFEVVEQQIEFSSISISQILTLIILFLIGILLILFVSKILNSTKDLKELKEENLAGLTDLDLKKFDLNLDNDLLKEQTFSLYKKLETAKTKQNLKNLDEILVDDLYLIEKQKILDLKENHEKAVATNIKLKNFKTLSIEKKNDTLTILTYLYVSQYDYILDKKKSVVRGTDESEYQIEYRITLEQSTNKQFKIKKKECLGKWIKN